MIILTTWEKVMVKLMCELAYRACKTLLVALPLYYSHLTHFIIRFGSVVLVFLIYFAKLEASIYHLTSVLAILLGSFCF